MRHAHLTCLALMVAVIFSSCSITGLRTGPSVPGTVPKLPKSPAYAAYLLAQYYLRVNEPEEAIKAYRQALEFDPDNPTILTDLAVVYVRQGKVQEALKLAEKAAEVDPFYEKAFVLLGRLYAGTGHNLKAINAYRRVIAINPQNPDAYLLLGTLYAQENRFREALEALEHLKTLLPDNPLAYYYKARVFLDMKFYDQAEAAYQEALQINPFFDRALLDLAYIYEVTERFSEAEATYLRLLSINPGHNQARTKLSNLYIREKLYDKALEQLRVLSQQNSEDLESRLKIGIIHLQQRKFKEAISDFQALLKDRPQYDQALYYLATSYEERGERADLEQAVVNLRLIPQTSPLWEPTQMRLAILFSKLNDHKSGIECLEKALRVKPQVVDFYLYLAYLYEETKDFAKALESLNAGIGVGGETEVLLFRKGIVLDRLNRKDEALEVMKKILTLDKDHAGALNYIGYTYADRGVRLDEAKELIERALAKEPQDGYIMDSLAWVHYRLGNYTKALEVIRKALELVPDDPIILEHYGDILKALERLQEARQAYEKALEKGHENPDLIQQKIQQIR
ncbi:tetratricopeptide repeat protein [Desulfosoma caldarium]|uniref:Tfp pilus assembly protein PilF n=1 Tax=Desulfosoma caldarium TaxID=610254 RepID=A0A3N1UM42_9BACT|nr:tetratricopeptide repeat protein [Desulfosoma caldarium]ROQ92275.1 Tfp pilus assembly protein PilF [Desulfosoma caldarium]